MENVFGGFCRKMENVFGGFCRKMENVLTANVVIPAINDWKTIKKPLPTTGNGFRKIKTLLMKKNLILLFLRYQERI